MAVARTQVRAQNPAYRSTRPLPHLMDAACALPACVRPRQSDQLRVHPEMSFRTHSALVARCIPRTHDALARCTTHTSRRSSVTAPRPASRRSQRVHLRIDNSARELFADTFDDVVHEAPHLHCTPDMSTVDTCVCATKCVVAKKIFGTRTSANRIGSRVTRTLQRVRAKISINEKRLMKQANQCSATMHGARVMRCRETSATS
jgi:hypothetical protein